MREEKWDEGAGDNGHGLERGGRDGGSAPPIGVEPRREKLRVMFKFRHYLFFFFHF